MEKELTGPALIGIADRVPNKAFIADILLRPREALQKYSYAAALSNKYGFGAHMSFKKTLTEKDIADIISFLWNAFSEPVLKP